MNASPDQRIFCSIATIAQLPMCYALISSIRRWRSDLFVILVVDVEQNGLPALPADLANVTLLTLDALRGTQRGSIDALLNDRANHQNALRWSLKPLLMIYLIEEKKARSVIYLDNYIEWKPNEQAQMMIDLYGWQPAQQKFDRTYRTISNLDDMHENGAHDYLKFIKFGYGRCSDHACKDIRFGKITREEGVELVKKYDHVRPSDLNRWCAYTGISHDEFDAIADTFRSPKVWWIQNGEWWKDNVWGGSSSFGPVRNKEVIEKFRALGRVM